MFEGFSVILLTTLALVLLAVSLFFNLLMHFFIARYNKY